MKTFDQFMARQSKHMDTYTPAQMAAAVAKLNPQIYDADGRIKLMHAWEWKVKFTPDELRAWAWASSVFCIPTIELVQWISKQIGQRRAIEIGAGNGDLGYHLGIHQTDARTSQPVKMDIDAAHMLARPATHPGPDVETLDGLAAVKKYSPAVVVAGWVTQLRRPGEDLGSDNGVDEEAILNWPGVECYIHVGHRRLHSYKRILKRRHREYNHHWLIGGTKDHEANFIAIWGV